MKLLFGTVEPSQRVGLAPADRLADTERERNARIADAILDLLYTRLAHLCFSGKRAACRISALNSGYS